MSKRKKLRKLEKKRQRIAERLRGAPPVRVRAVGDSQECAGGGVGAADGHVEGRGPMKPAAANLLKIDRWNPLAVKLYLVENGRRRMRRTPYYKAMIFHDVDELRRFAVEQSKHVLEIQRRAVTVKVRFASETRRPRHWRHCCGFARHFAGATCGKDNRQIGVVCFARTHLGGGVVAHEFSHAALYHISRGGPPCRVTLRDDERLAWHAGEMNRQFYRFYWKMMER